MTTMQQAFKKSGFKIRKVTKSWPRPRKVKVVTVDCTHSQVKNVLFRKEN